MTNEVTVEAVNLKVKANYLIHCIYREMPTHRQAIQQRTIQRWL